MKWYMNDFAVEEIVPPEVDQVIPEAGLKQSYKFVATGLTTTEVCYNTRLFNFNCCEVNGK